VIEQHFCYNLLYKSWLCSQDESKKNKKKKGENLKLHHSGIEKKLAVV
jgi:hypothetical protein